MTWVFSLGTKLDLGNYPDTEDEFMQMTTGDGADGKGGLIINGMRVPTGKAVRTYLRTLALSNMTASLLGAGGAFCAAAATYFAFLI